jgi:single-stranded DNA-binding protein
MNYASVCAILAEDPHEVYTSATTYNWCATVYLPPVGNKSQTQIDLHVYGKAADKFQNLKKGSRIYVHGAKLRFDVEERLYSLHGGIIVPVTESFPVFNDVILTGRCIKDIDTTDARAFKTTANGLMICNQTLSVNTGKNQADLFNFYAINSVDDKLNQAELLANFTRKGTGITIRGRLVTDSWTDQDTKERRHLTKIQLVNMTLAPRNGESQTKQVEPKTTVASSNGVANLWGGKTAEEPADPWNQASGGGLPDLPGQYGASPEFADGLPF